MDGFAVDLDDLLDEFEQNEDTPKQTAAGVQHKLAGPSYPAGTAAETSSAYDCSVTGPTLTYSVPYSPPEKLDLSEADFGPSPLKSTGPRPEALGAEVNGGYFVAEEASYVHSAGDTYSYTGVGADMTQHMAGLNISGYPMEADHQPELLQDTRVGNGTCEPVSASSAVEQAGTVGVARVSQPDVVPTELSAIKDVSMASCHDTHHGHAHSPLHSYGDTGHPGGADASIHLANSEAQPSVPAVVSQVPGVPAVASQVPGVPAVASQVPGVPAVASQVPGVPAVASQVPGVPAVSQVSGVPAVASQVPGVPAVASQVPGVPAVNQVSGVPAVASQVPGVPAVSQVPGVPAASQVPGVPAVSQVPGVPAVGQVPGVPAHSGPTEAQTYSQGSGDVVDSFILSNMTDESASHAPNTASSHAPSTASSHAPGTASSHAPSSHTSSATVYSQAPSATAICIEPDATVYSQESSASAISQEPDATVHSQEGPSATTDTQVSSAMMSEQIMQAPGASTVGQVPSAAPSQTAPMQGMNQAPATMTTQTISQTSSLHQSSDSCDSQAICREGPQSTAELSPVETKRDAEDAAGHSVGAASLKNSMHIVQRPDSDTDGNTLPTDIADDAYALNKTGSAQVYTPPPSLDAVGLQDFDSCALEADELGPCEVEGILDQVLGQGGVVAESERSPEPCESGDRRSSEGSIERFLVPSITSPKVTTPMEESGFSKVPGFTPDLSSMAEVEEQHPEECSYQAAGAPKIGTFASGGGVDDGVASAATNAVHSSINSAMPETQAVGIPGHDMEPSPQTGIGARPKDLSVSPQPKKNRPNSLLGLSTPDIGCLKPQVPGGFIDTSGFAETAAPPMDPASDMGIPDTNAGNAHDIINMQLAQKNMSPQRKKQLNLEIKQRISEVVSDVPGGPGEMPPTVCGDHAPGVAMPGVPAQHLPCPTLQSSVGGPPVVMPPSSLSLPPPASDLPPGSPSGQQMGLRSQQPARQRRPNSLNLPPRGDFQPDLSPSAGEDSIGYGGDSVGYGGDSVGYGGDTVGYGGDSVMHAGDSVGYGGDSVMQGGDSVVHGGDGVMYAGDGVQQMGYPAGESNHTPSGSTSSTPSQSSIPPLVAGVVPAAPIRGPGVTGAPPTSSNINLTITQLGKVAPEWVPDSVASACMQCELKFSFTKRRHHCRACGKVFCSQCCNLRTKIHHMENKEARVCSKCYQDLIRAQVYERMHQGAPSPNPNNPSEYCSTVPPMQQAQARLNAPPPAVMVPVGVLRKEGSLRRPEPRQVIFSDGIRPGGDLTELDGSSEGRLPAQRSSGRRSRRVEKNTDNKTVSTKARTVKIAEAGKSPCLIPETGLPPVILSTGIKGDYSVEENPEMEKVIVQIRSTEDTSPVVFAINKNLFVMVKIVNLDCCVNRVCWCFTTKGMCTVGQEELVIVLECLPDEKTIPRDIFCHFLSVYEEASKGNTVSNLGHTIFAQGFLDSRDHSGFLYVRPTFQCLQKLLLPQPPYVFGILLQKWETPWAKIFPVRLMLRLGAEYRYYPCPLISVRFRKPVYCEIGHTIMNLLADFRNYQYMLPQARGVTIHMEDKKTFINFPKNRYNEVMKILDNSNDHVMAMGANFSTEADSHLVCIQNEDGNYQTQAINIQNKPRKVTGASFVVFNGALKSSSGLRAKSSIVEDGLMVQITSEAMSALKQAIKDMLGYTVGCGSLDAAQPEEYVIAQWVDDDKNVNIGVKSPIDNMAMDGVESVHLHNTTDYIGECHTLRWTEVFFIQNEDQGTRGDPVDLSRLGETLAQACCLALTPHLAQLKEASLTRIGLRVTMDAERVGYEVGANGEKLPDMYMNDMDNELIPVIHNAASHTQDGPVILELILHIIE